VYKDRFCLERYDARHSSDGEDRFQIIGQPYMQDNTDILMVVETSKTFVPGKIHIVSAMILRDPVLLKEYERKKKEMIAQQKKDIDYLTVLMDRTF
jgi:hypothetical protein